MFVAFHVAQQVLARVTSRVDLLTVSVEIVSTVWPRQLAAERRKQVVERPADDHVVEDTDNELSEQHAQTQTCRSQVRSG